MIPIDFLKNKAIMIAIEKRVNRLPNRSVISNDCYGYKLNRFLCIPKCTFPVINQINLGYYRIFMIQNFFQHAPFCIPFFKVTLK